MGRRKLQAAALVALVALAVAACSNSSNNTTTSNSSASGGGSSTGSSSSADTTTHVAVDAPGVTDTEIHFSSLGTNSNNPLGTCVLDCFDNGIKAYFDFRNSQGGIYGRQLVLSEEIDDQLSNNQPKAADIISANDTFATFSATQIPTGWGDLADAGIPLYTWSIFPDEMKDHPQIFGYTGTLCTTCTSRAAAYEAKVAGATKVATLGYGISANSKECADGAAKSIQKYASNIGNPTVAFTNDNLDFGLPNGVAPEVSQMKSDGVDFVIACLDLNGMKTIAQELQRQGIRDKVKLFHPNTYDQQFVLDAGGLFVGDLVGVSFRPFEADPGTSGLKDFRAAMAKLGKTETEISMIGWINADLAYQALVAAGPSFDRQKVIDGANQKLTTFTANGLIPPIDWSKAHTAATEEDPALGGGKYDCVALVKVGPDSKFQMVGDAAKPWSCWPNDTRDWSDPVSMDFS